jgi:signal transduction histidine kinase
MIGVLRHGDEELAGATAPALSQLGGLVARARAAGLPVELRIDGEPRELTPGLDLVAFRVVQEALTNAIKQARRSGAGPGHGHIYHGRAGARDI